MIKNKLIKIKSSDDLMLYNKSAVKNKVPLTQEQIALARKSPFLRSERALEKFFNSVFKRKKNDLETMLHATKELSKFVKYDHYHRFQGIRHPTKTLCDLKGHCIEQNSLLYVLARHLGVRTKLVVMKNPKGFKATLKEEGIHPFLRFKCDKATYLADQVSAGVYVENKGIWYAAKQEMSLREFTAFCITMGGEDLSRGHKKPKEAINYFRVALAMDPNNYTSYLYLADSLLDLGRIEPAKNCVEKAVKMTPGLADPYKIWGDTLLLTEDYDGARTAYLEAAERESKDFQLLYDLERKLKRVGETSARKRVYEKRSRLLDSKPDKIVYDMVLIKINPQTGERRIETQKDYDLTGIVK